MKNLIGTKNLKDQTFSFFNLVSVKSKLTIVLLGILCVSFIISGSIIYTVTTNALIEAKEIEMDELLKIPIESIDEELKAIQPLTGIITSNPEVQRDIRSGSVGQDVSDYLDYMADSSEFIENIFITDASGNINAVSDFYSMRLNISDRDYYIKSQAGEANISEIVVSKLTGNHVFVYAEPIFYPDFKGIVAITLNFDRIFKENVEVINLGQTGYFWALDQEGHTILHPNPDVAHKVNIFDMENADELHDLARKMIRGESGSSKYMYNGIERYAVFAPVGNWHLAISIDVSEIMASALNVRNIFLVTGILSLLIAGLLINVLVSKEEKLRVSEERYRLLIENANEAIIVVQAGRNVFFNPKALQIFGCSESQFKSTSYMEFIHPEDRNEVVQRHLKRMTGDVAQDKYPMRIVAADGSIKWAEVNAVVIQWEGSAASLVLLNDVTERKLTEQKIIAYTMELEQKGIELEELYGQLYEEIDKARYIHERTLPVETPQMEGISLAAHYQPAMHLGGDFYDSIRVDNKLVLYISDVSGHGMEGAILSIFTKEAIDSYVTLKSEEIDPGKILRHLNRQYRRENYPDDYFICIFLAVLDLNTMELSYTSAGFQESPLLRTGSGQRQRLIVEGLPVSTAVPMEIMDFTVKHITLTPGTTVLVTTDGLTEQAMGKAQYGCNLEEVFYAHSHLPPEVIVRAINNDFYRFNNGSLQGDDDITFGIIQVDPEKKLEYNLELESSFTELNRLLREMTPAVTGIAGGDQFLAGLHELAANAIEHGNRFDPAKIVTIIITITETYLHAQIRDQGEGFNWQERIDRPLEMDGYEERGRGIAMLPVCYGQIFFNKKGNRVTFTVTTG